MSPRLPSAGGSVPKATASAESTKPNVHERGERGSRLDRCLLVETRHYLSALVSCPEKIASSMPAANLAFPRGQTCPFANSVTPACHSVKPPVNYFMP